MIEQDARTIAQASIGCQPRTSPYAQLYGLYRKLYIALGNPESGAVEIGDVLTVLRSHAVRVL